MRCCRNRGARQAGGNRCDGALSPPRWFCWWPWPVWSGGSGLADEGRAGFRRAQARIGARLGGFHAECSMDVPPGPRSIGHCNLREGVRANVPAVSAPKSPVGSRSPERSSSTCVAEHEPSFHDGALRTSGNDPAGDLRGCPVGRCHAHLARQIKRLNEGRGNVTVFLST